MAILLLADHDNASLSDQTAKALTAAQRQDRRRRACAGGRQGRQGRGRCRCKALRRLQGAARRKRRPCQQLAEPLADLIVSLAGSYDTIISAATSTGKNVLPRVAALLDVAQVSEIIEVVSADTFKRPIYAGNAIQTVQSTDAKKVITVRTASFAAAPKAARHPVETIRRRQPRPLDLRQGRAVLLGSSGTDLGQDHHLGRPRARLVGKVPGSHPAGCRQARCRRRRIARCRRCRLCAERLAGRPDRQGRRAAALHRGRHLRRHPASGRHEGSKVIVAINKDEEAPIFQVADYGLEEDLFTAVPAMLEALK
jgi:electron transfer flavoprotein alpha subunit